MNIKLSMTYKVPKGISLSFESAWFDENHFHSILTDLQKMHQVTDIFILDEMGQEWTQKEFLKLKKKQEDKPTKPKVYFDGSFDKESGRAGIGMVIYYEKGHEEFRYRLNAKVHSMNHNNEAEYASLYNAIAMLEEIGITHMPVEIYGDSQGVIKQLEGEWPCFDQNLNKWLDRIEQKVSQLAIKPILNVIPRNQNKEADQLASQALTGQSISSHKKLE